MYKYIKGNTVLSKERMLSAFEIAQKYNLSKPNNNIPNDTLINTIIKTYLEKHNYKVSEYYYINENTGTFFKVYPIDMILVIMESFIEYLKVNNIEMSDTNIYRFKDIDFMYREFPVATGKIISFKKNNRKR